MNATSLGLVAATMMSAAVIAPAGCNTTPVGTQSVSVTETGDAVTMVGTTRITATVYAIDAVTRKVTITTADGKHTTVKCGPEVRNFAKIQIGDKVTFTATEELALYVSGTRPKNAAAAKGVAVRPLGDKPGIVMADAVEVTAKITAIDATDRHVTVELPDGQIKTFKVGKNADLNGLKPGDSVTAQYVEAVAITVEKPTGK